MNIDLLKNQVSNHISNNRLEDSLNLISENDSVFEYSKSNEVMLLMSRLNSLNRDNRTGTITPQQSNMRRNQIVSAILDLCDIKTGTVKINGNSNVKEFPQKNNCVSFKEIKEVLKGIKNEKNEINYFEAVEVLADLF